MKRTLLAIVVGSALASLAASQEYAPPSGCAGGQCPVVAAPLLDARAIVRVVNVRGAGRSVGTGTLVDGDDASGLVVTCAHLFSDGVGSVSVIFPSGRTFEARLLKLDATADLAALGIGPPGVAPVAIAQRHPERGDPLVSCGYGSDGRLWCNRGQALGYVATAGAQGTETLELSGVARFGDSGGPVLDRDHKLVAVLFGTNGRVVDGTFCGRVRRFLRGLSPRFGADASNAPLTPPPRSPDQSDPPLVEVPSAPAPKAPPAPETPPAADRLKNLEELVARIHKSWQGISAKLDGLTEAAKNARPDVADKDGDTPLAPPQVELPPGLERLDPIADAARPWLSAELAAVLVSFGVPGGIAGVAAGTIVYVVMRRARRRLQSKLDRLTRHGEGAGATEPSGEAAEASDPAVVERHHNQYVAYEVTALDKAWAAAHAHVGEKYPGAVPYLRIAEGVKDQLLSGHKDSSSSEGRLP